MSGYYFCYAVTWPVSDVTVRPRRFYGGGVLAPRPRRPRHLYCSRHSAPALTTSLFYRVGYRVCIVCSAVSCSYLSTWSYSETVTSSLT
jgi:hypothetical protein